MKRRTFSIFIFLVTISAWAYDAYINGLYYNLNSYTKEASVTYKTELYNSYNGSIYIPSNVDYQGICYDVTSIDEYAFCGCSDLTYIEIPSSITSIGDYAFRRCKSLSSIDIPNGITTINDGTFADCTNLTSIEIPYNVTLIKSSAFSGCSNLNTVIIPEGVTTIGNDAFLECKKLSNVLIPQSVINIGSGAFQACKSLTSIKLPKGIEVIKDWTFCACSNLNTIIIPNSVSSIGNYAFADCTNLTSVISNIKTPFSFNTYSFPGISSTCCLIIPNGSKDLYIAHGWTDDCFQGGLIESAPPIIFKDAIVKSLCVDYWGHWDTNEDGELDYDEAAKITSLNKVFNNHNGIEYFDELQYFTGLTRIGDGEFAECQLLKSIILPEGILYIGDGAFKNCSSLTEFVIPENLLNSNENAFSGCNGLTSVSIKSKVVQPWFAGLSNITEVTFGENVSNIYDDAFKECKNLSSINLPKSMVSVGSNAFKNCRSLKTVNMQEGLMNIGDEAFAYCHNIESLSFPSTLKNIGKKSFYYCYSIKYVISCSNNPPVCDTDALDMKSNQTCTLFVPLGTAQYYKEAYQWKNFSSIRENSKPIFTVTYKVDNVEYQSEEVEYDTPMSLIDEPTKEGYTFSGWSEIPATMPANDVTIEGTFSINSYKLTYLVDGEEYQSTTIKYGDAITSIDEPTKEGYTFSGWSEIPATMPAKDVTIEGSFSINSYKLTYLVDGEEYQSTTVKYGDAITPINEPTKEGYTFSGWSEIPATMPAKDVTIEGTFSINSYKLTYLVDGEEYQSSTLKYGDAIIPINEPTKEGYTFSGWSEIPATMPAKDVTIEGTFSINSYKLTYLVDGEEYKTTEVEYGSPITPEQEPMMEGFIFSGWSEIPETMPAHDVTIEGSFTPDTTGFAELNAANGVKPNGKYIEGNKVVIWQNGTKFFTSGTIAR